MKLLFLFFIGVLFYFLLSFAVKRVFPNFAKKFSKGWRILTSVALVFLMIFGIGVHEVNQPDIQCGREHTTTSRPPDNLITAQDYFEQGNYDYDIGNCQEALILYTRAIELNLNYAEAYNNRAYTNMRMRNYTDALPDLDKAIELRPNYIQALMNRGDIHNYYQIDRALAIADYEKVMDLGATKTTSVCGHLFLAKHDGWNLGTVLGFPTALISCHK